jgi:glutamate/tyrosine decarboxylase-like PLP-dependent enzyme
VSKAAGLLGIGRDNVRKVATDARFRMDVSELERCIGQDLAGGHTPACIVANAGAVSTGAFDPIAAIAAVARRHGLWLHVDGAYGGFAALAAEARPLFEAIGEADSVALDPHKWLYLPMGCGCVLYRDPAAARAAFSHQAEYTRPVGWEDDEAFAFWDYGPELSRPFRALNVWLLLKHAGARALGEAISRNIACAKHVERLIESTPGLEMMAPVELSIFCFRCRPAGFSGDLDALNERILVELQRQGSSYLSNAGLRGRFALRGCVLNYRTTPADMEVLLEDVRRAERAVLSSVTKGSL